MNNENYIVINGQKAELTEEQLKRLGIEVKPKRNNPFHRTERHDDVYYSIDVNDVIICDTDGRFDEDDDLFACANYFNDKAFANQVMLHQQLCRKLLKYAYDNNAEDCEWNNDHNYHYSIYFDYKSNEFMVAPTALYKDFCVYFSKIKVAEQAIKDVVEPFMREHPEFVW